MVYSERSGEICVVSLQLPFQLWGMCGPKQVNYI